MQNRLFSFLILGVFISGASLFTIGCSSDKRPFKEASDLDFKGEITAKEGQSLEAIGLLPGKYTVRFSSGGQRLEIRSRASAEQIVLASDPLPKEALRNLDVRSGDHTDEYAKSIRVTIVGHKIRKPFTMKVNIRKIIGESKFTIKNDSDANPSHCMRTDSGRYVMQVRFLIASAESDLTTLGEFYGRSQMWENEYKIRYDRDLKRCEQN